MTRPFAAQSAVLETSAATAKDMETLGHRLGETLLSSAELSGQVLVFLRGPLGAGKTTLARGVIRAFGVEGIVRSPTYTLVEPYETSRGRVTHVDLYRLAEPNEVEFLALEEHLESGVCLIEWPERAESALPPAGVEIVIYADSDPRQLSISSSTARGADLVEALGASLKV